ncbi:MAG TPA: ATP-binding protein [Gaiellaceae bacterium]|nr:ATP-binding protein [Gaiellaceae bacterium]
MSRLPIRVRLTLPFALGMAIVLAAMGVVIYVRVGNALLASVDQNLNAQAAEALTHAERGRKLLDNDVSEGPAIAQVQLLDGTIDDSSPAGMAALLDTSDLRAIAKPTRRTEEVKGLRGEWRLRAVPLQLDGRRAVLVVGRSVQARAETLHHLEREFLLAAPAALLLSLLGGYVLAAAALRPVEAMRRRAGVISATTPGRRLPVPRTTDEVSALAITLNEMLGRLESALEHERRFVADASHELRTPLALLRAELDLALRRPRTRDELEAAVRSAAEETERLSRLAEDLLLIARADQGSVPLRIEHVDVPRLLEDVRRRFAPRAHELGRSLVVSAAGELEAEADPLRLEQALGNLVDNALVYGAGCVTLSAVPSGDMVELHVADEGNGFPPEFVERAFDRFSRADDARSAPGTGLGLAIVALVAGAHGGTAVAGGGANGADVWLTVRRHSRDPPAISRRSTPTSA